MWNLIESLYLAFLVKKGQKLLGKAKPEKALGCLQKAYLAHACEANCFNLALCYAALLMLDNAQKLLEILIVSPTYCDHELVLISLADVYIMQKKWDAARKILSKLQKAHPKNEIYVQQNQLINDEKARENYVESRLIFHEGLKKFQEKNYQAAYDFLIKAHQLDKTNAFIVANLASVSLFLKQDANTTYAYFETACQLAPDNQKFRNNLVYAKRKLRR